jgi:hypothetical protein
VKREIADAMAERGDYHASVERAEAANMDEAAGRFLDLGSHLMHVTSPVEVGNGDEMLVVTREMQASIPGAVDTVREKPSMLAAEASETRVKLAGDSVVLAVDAAVIGSRPTCSSRSRWRRARAPTPGSSTRRLRDASAPHDSA